jgi:hypothetical protein
MYRSKTPLLEPNMSQLKPVNTNILVTASKLIRLPIYA